MLTRNSLIPLRVFSYFVLLLQLYVRIYQEHALVKSPHFAGVAYPLTLFFGRQLISIKLHLPNEQILAIILPFLFWFGLH